MRLFRLALWKKLALIIVLIVLIILFYLFKNAFYVLSEFVFISNSANMLVTCEKTDSFKRIPSLIHQIHGFKDSKMKASHVKKIRTWKQNHQNYTSYLWNETSANNLIEREYNSIYNLYKSYGSWIQRADVARYVILYHYGGWYIDLDVKCNGGLHEIVDEAYQLNKRVILHTTFPWGTSNDIFGITPRHPFLKFVLSNLHNANRWYLIPHWNILLSAGSTYMWGRYLNYPCKDDILVLDKDRYPKYFLIEHDGSWHSWDDTVVIALFSLTKTRVLLTFFMVLFSVLCAVLLRKHLCPRRQLRLILNSNDNKHFLPYSSNN